MQDYQTSGHNGDADRRAPTEDQFTKTVDTYTASIPSSGYLAVAVGAMAASLVFQVTGRGKWGNFIAQWVPTLLIIGLYNKIVKLKGHDYADRGTNERLGEYRCGICDSNFSSPSDLQFHQKQCSARTPVS
jgi:hypothetical protein